MVVYELSNYEIWEIRMNLAGKWVPCMGESIFVPYEDDIDCFEEVWDGNIDQQEYAEAGLIYSTASEAVARARKDMEVALGHVS